MIWNTDLIEALELENLLTQGAQTMFAAENRQESRGAQVRGARENMLRAQLENMIFLHANARRNAA